MEFKPMVKKQQNSIMNMQFLDISRECIYNPYTVINPLIIKIFHLLLTLIRIKGDKVDSNEKVEDTVKRERMGDVSHQMVAISISYLILILFVFLKGVFFGFARTIYNVITTFYP